MKLAHLKIHNYRSAADVDIDVPDMLILIGPNNHGKSNILSAIEFGLSTSVKPDKDDFFSFRGDDDFSLWVEMTFSALTDQEKTTFKKYVRGDVTICIRKTARLQDGDGVEISYNGYMQEPKEWWLKSSAFERLSTREKVDSEAKEIPALSELAQGGGKFTKQRIQDFQNEYISAHRNELKFTETLEESPLLGQKNIVGGMLPEFFMVPAVRDLSDETKVKTTTVFGRLLQRTVRDMTERDPRFIELRERLQGLVAELNVRPKGSPEDASELARLETSLTNELTSWGVGVSIVVTPPEIEKVFELGTQLHLDDGLKTLAEKKGHGLQRAVLFALLRVWAKVLRAPGQTGSTKARQASESAYFAMEEPELFLHPHAQRQLFESLAKIAEVLDHQVFLCTHSTHFVDLEHYQRIAIVSKDTPRRGSTIRQCTVDLFSGDDAADRKRRFHMAAWVNPDRAEIFFARKVVLAEGETEKTLIPFLARKLGCVDADVSVVDCGCKHNLPLYITILNAYRIPYCVIHDEDYLPNPIPPEWNDEKRASERRTFEMNKEIARLIDPEIGVVEMLIPDFEGVSGISRTSAKKKGKVIAALDYFYPMPGEELPPRIAEIVRRAYCIDPPEPRNS